MADKGTEIQSCPKCGAQTTNLVDIDAGMRLALRTTPGAGSLPSQVCNSCYTTLTGQVSQGVKLLLEKKAKEKNKHMLWKSRVNLVKNARTSMANKKYADAAVQYEKYIRVLEISYELKPGELSPKVFGNSSRSKELTIIATTYWDLFRIYDTMPQYRERMAKSAQKLSEFLPFSPICPDVLKRAQTFVRNAKNPDIVRNFLSKNKKV